MENKITFKNGSEINILPHKNVVRSKVREIAKNVMYRDFEIHLTREKSIIGNFMWFYHIIAPDGEFIVESFSDSNDTYSAMLEDMRNTIDEYIEHPEYY